MKEKPILFSGEMVRAILDGWERQERGWWTHEKRGGICREKRGWWVYGEKHDPRGPFRTLREAVLSTL